MSQRDPRVALQQMHSHAREALAVLQGRSRTELDSDRLLCLALIPESGAFRPGKTGWEARQIRL